MAIKEDFLIEKRNILNDIRANSMSLQELRFFSIYLSKINSRDPNTRVVRFSLNEFQKVMEFKSHIKIDHVKKVTNSLLCKVVNIPIENGGYEGFQLFKRCKINPDEDGEWYVEIDAHDNALPLMFQFKERYFTYQLWNALRLKSSNQLRMYEILKQYEKTGERVISVKNLKELLGVGVNEYPRYNDFKTHVLDVCQKALENYTDIKYTYEPTGRRGKGGKILNLKFAISKNEEYADKLTLSEFIAQQGLDRIMDESDEEQNYFKDEVYPFITEACGNEFSLAEMQVLYNLAIQIVPHKSGRHDFQLEIYNYLKRRYDELIWRSSNTPITSRMGYIKRIIEADLEQF